MPIDAPTGDLVAAFWRFSVDIYGRPGMRPLLLDCQDQGGANVNLMLLCIWAGEQGQKLDAKALNRAKSAVAGWSAAVTNPLRAQRRRLKQDWQELAPDVEPIRQAILAAELEAEKTEQALMIAALAPWPAPLESAAEQVLANLTTYLGSAMAAPAASIAAICSGE
jgi:uncharacterized protein (TIGR02444 family)